MGFDPASAFVIGSSVIGGGADILGGASEKSARFAEAKQYENNAKLTAIAAQQEEAARRQDLLSARSSINAYRTARGLDIASPTGMAISDAVTADAERAIGTVKLNAAGQVSSLYNQATIARNQGNAAYIGGFLKAGSRLLNTFGAPKGGGGGSGGAGSGGGSGKGK
jgi:hypothetical protein